METYSRFWSAYGGSATYFLLDRAGWQEVLAAAAVGVVVVGLLEAWDWFQRHRRAE